MQRLFNLPLLVILTGVSGLSMLLPAAHAAVHGHMFVARTFFYSGVLCVVLAVVLGIATATIGSRHLARSQLGALLGAYLWLPLLLAIPLNESVPDTTYMNAWFEMVSSFTTTGATLYGEGGRLAPSLHLWRALVGWMGGFFVLITAVAVLAPIDLGGVEVFSGRVPGRGAAGTSQITRGADPSERLRRHTIALFPVYCGLTLALWIVLLTAGELGLPALVHAMSTLSTSGISPGQGMADTAAGLPGEVAIFGFMALAISRRSLPGAVLTDRNRAAWQDPEIRLAMFFLILVPTVLFLRHWLAAISVNDQQDWHAAFGALWGALFTTMSFLTTTGFESAEWDISRVWSGLNAPGLVLLGLAMMGGGIGTTAGGLKLLRIYALARHGERELDRLVHPSSIGGGGEIERRIRRSGAYAAWIFFMLFALSFAVLMAILTIFDIEFETALILSVAAITTTGPLVQLAGEEPISLIQLSGPVKVILGAAMIVGRVEILAIIAFLAPGTWRR